MSTATESKYKYNSWPLGKIPKEFQRPEPDKLKELGYAWDDPRDIIDIFEKKVADFAGSKYAVSTDCCSNGIFLCLKYVDSTFCTITIPKQTYVSVPMQIKHAGFGVRFRDIEWSGYYHLDPLHIYDGAGRWKKDMFSELNDPEALYVMSFQIKKSLPIGRGGMILTDSEEAYKKLKLMTYDGRDLTLPYTDKEHIKTMGYHMYMTPEDAARGLILMDNLPDELPDSYNHTMYPSLQEKLREIL